MKTSHARLALAAAALQLAWMTVACTDALYSDAENAGRKSMQSRQAALRSMKSSSSAAATATPVSGQDLTQLLAGHTHVDAFVKRAGDAKPYLTTYDYYGPDGTFIAKDTYSRRTADYYDVGRWTVHANVLCITLPSRPEDACFTIRLTADGTIQYWIHKPGDPFDGLLTRNVTVVRNGPQEPEYTSDPAAFR
ncbi:MAG: hypothetical protein ABI564_03250 [Ideonella sp.]